MGCQKGKQEVFIDSTKITTTADIKINKNCKKKTVDENLFSDRFILNILI